MNKSPIRKEVYEDILTLVRVGKDLVSVIAKQYGIISEAIYY